jgi:hypothetical protein
MKWRRGRGAWGVAALTMLAAMVAGGEARAGAIVIVSGTTEQTGDPIYTYFFDVELLAGFTLQTNGFFTVYDIPGIVIPAPTTQPSIFWGASQQNTGITPLGVSPPIVDNPNIPNATWEWHGNPIVAGGSNLDLGIFTIQTTELTAPPTPTLVYVGSLDGVNASNPPGTITVNFVPEPASILLLSPAAVFVLAVCARGRRRRRAALAA